MKKLLLSALAFTIVVSCSEKKEVKSSLKETTEIETLTAIQPVEGLEVPVRTFSVDISKNAIIELPNGGSIEFKSESLVDEDGNEVSGKVDIHWQEFHSLTDIMLSGIPMKYDSMGVSYDFISGGMFTINATQGDRNLKIKNEESVLVNLASQNEKESFNFYKIDEKTGVWDYLDTKNGVKSEEAEAETPELIDATVNTENFPELEQQQIVAWKPSQKLTENEKFSIENQHAKVSLSKEENFYFLNFLRGKLKSKIKVEPVSITEAKSWTIREKKRMEENYVALVRYQDEAAKGKVIRSIEIDGFGTYNWDIKYKRKNSKPLMAKFDYGNNVQQEFVKLFHVSPNENAVVNYSPDEDNNFSFDPKGRNFLVAILPDKKIMYVDDKGFDDARKTTRASHVFRFKKSDIVATSGKDLGTKIYSELLR